jgi:protein TonB
MKLLLTTVIAFMALGAAAQDTANQIFIKTEIEAAFPGGDIAWMHFLNKHLHYPDDAISNEIQGTVIVQFIVDTAGNISDIKAVSGPTKGGLREESVRVVGLSGKWVPALQNGHQVRSYKKVPIQFKMSSH